MMLLTVLEHLENINVQLCKTTILGIGRWHLHRTPARAPVQLIAVS